MLFDFLFCCSWFMIHDEKFFLGLFFWFRLFVQNHQLFVSVAPGAFNEEPRQVPFWQEPVREAQLAKHEAARQTWSTVGRMSDGAEKTAGFFFCRIFVIVILSPYFLLILPPGLFVTSLVAWPQTPWSSHWKRLPEDGTHPKKLSIH